MKFLSVCIHFFLVESSQIASRVLIIHLLQFINFWRQTSTLWIQPAKLGISIWGNSPRKFLEKIFQKLESISIKRTSKKATKWCFLDVHSTRPGPLGRLGLFLQSIHNPLWAVQFKCSTTVQPTVGSTFSKNIIFRNQDFKGFWNIKGGSGTTWGLSTSGRSPERNRLLPELTLLLL